MIRAKLNRGALAVAIGNTTKTQKDITKEMGIGNSTLSSWIDGRFDPPIDKAKQLAEVLNVAESELIEEVHEQKHGVDINPDKGGKDITTNPNTKDKPVSDRVLTIQAEDELLAKCTDYFLHHVNVRSVAYLNSWLAFQKTILNNQKEVK